MHTHLNGWEYIPGERFIDGRGLSTHYGPEVIIKRKNGLDPKRFQFGVYGDVEAEANACLTANAPKLLNEVERYLPILEKLESNPTLWSDLTAGTGIATLNGLKHAIETVKNYKRY